MTHPTETRPLQQSVYAARTQACMLRAQRLLLADGAPTVGWGKSFWRVGQVFFTKTTVTRKRKAEQTIPRCEMQHHFDGYKGAIDKIWGSMDFWAENQVFRPKKRIHLWLDARF